MRAAGRQAPADNQLVARTHRQLLSMAQMRREPVIINRLAPARTVPAARAVSASCPVRCSSTGGKPMGVLALFRDEDSRGIHAARCAPGRHPGAQGERHHRKQLRRDERPLHAPGVRAARACGGQRIRSARAMWSALYIDTDQLHVINDNFGMHVGDTRHRPARRAACAGACRRALLPRASPATASRCCCRRASRMPRSSPSPCAKARSSSARCTASRACTCPSASAWRRSIREAGELMHSLAAAETACKAAKDRGRNRVEVVPDERSEHRAPLRRTSTSPRACAMRSPRIGCAWMRSSSCRFSRGASTRAALRAAAAHDRRGRRDTVGPDRFLSAANRYQLMPTIDRWVIDKAIELLKPHAELLARRAVGFAINFSGPVAER